MIDRINAIAEQWFQWQWAMLWQSAVFILIVAVVDCPVDYSENKRVLIDELARRVCLI